jgi:microsomal dipeptidase-like Zn-dependent dipeptidase
MPRLLSPFLALATLVPAQLVAQDPDLIARAKAIHERVLTLDTHVDINPGNFTVEKSYATKLPTQVNIPAMEEGGLDAAFLIVFVGQDQDFTAEGYAKAHAAAIAKFDAIHRLTTVLAPDRVELARTAADVRRIYASGKKVILIGIENGYQLGEDLDNVRQFAELGGRYLSLAHNGHSQLSDSNTGEKDDVWTWHGLSPLGRKVIPELNKWGIMIDVSHPSKQSMMQTVALSRAPIIASHSAIRSLCNHSRNMDDEQLRALARSGGVIQVVAFSSYLKCKTPGDSAAPRATIKDLGDHIDYAVKLIGIDHVGIASDFDGGGGVEGWRNATETGNVTLELVRRGYTEDQIAKLWSGNLLRVMEQVERIGKKLRGDNTP